MKCLNNQDKHIAYVAITELRGQAQYDFLQDYFNQIRKETLEWVKEQINILMYKKKDYPSDIYFTGWTNGLFMLNKKLEEQSK